MFDVSVSPDGGKIAVMTLCGASGAYYSELVVKNIKTDKTVAYEKFDGVKPVGVEFFSDGSFFAAVNGTLCFYRSDGEKTAQTSRFLRFAAISHRRKFRRGPDVCVSGGRLFEPRLRFR